MSRSSQVKSGQPESSHDRSGHVNSRQYRDFQKEVRSGGGQGLVNVKSSKVSTG